MLGALVEDEGIPVLTSRFLVLFEDADVGIDVDVDVHKEDLLVGLKPKQVRPGRTNRLEESKDPDEPPMLASHHKNSSPLWSPLPRFDTIPGLHDCSLPNIPSCPMPPSTPLSTNGAGVDLRLFASFSSSPISSEGNMWKYNDKASNPSYSPLTTDALGQENIKAAAAVWRFPEANRNNNSGSNHKRETIPNHPTLAPSLLLDDPADNLPSHQQHSHNDGPPPIIRYRTRTYSTDYFCGKSVGGSFEYEDEVSLLADDPDEDDDGVLPHATYDVLFDILDEIDKDDGDDDGAAIENYW